MPKKSIYGVLWDQVKFSRPDLVLACEEIVNTVYATNGILARPKVFAYLTKKNGDKFWQDNSQSTLVSAFYLSDPFEETEPVGLTEGLKPPEDERVSCYYRCLVDGSCWGLNTFEWRMGAEKYRLLYCPDGSPTVPAPIYAGSLVLPGSPPDLAAVIGNEPAAPRLSIDEWKNFLLS